VISSTEYPGIPYPGIPNKPYVPAVDEFKKLIEAQKTSQPVELLKQTVTVPSSRLQGNLVLDPNIVAISDFEFHFRRSAELRAWSLVIGLGASALSIGIGYAAPDRARVALGVVGVGSIISLGCYIASLVDDFSAADILDNYRQFLAKYPPKSGKNVPPSDLPVSEPIKRSPTLDTGTNF
jgi:hypothetical protein